MSQVMPLGRRVPQVRAPHLGANLGRADGRLQLTVCRRPLRFNLNHAHLAERILAEAAPAPVFRLLHQSASHGIPVQVAQLHGELGGIPDIAVIVAFLPKGPSAGALATRTLGTQDPAGKSPTYPKIGDMWATRPLPGSGWSPRNLLSSLPGLGIYETNVPSAEA